MQNRLQIFVAISFPMLTQAFLEAVTGSEFDEIQDRPTNIGCFALCIDSGVEEGAVVSEHTIYYDLVEAFKGLPQARDEKAEVNTRIYFWVIESYADLEHHLGMIPDILKEAINMNLEAA